MHPNTCLTLVFTTDFGPDHMSDVHHLQLLIQLIFDCGGEDITLQDYKAPDTSIVE